MTPKDVLESLNQLRLSNTNCDVIFEIGTKAFPAHRVVLMARLEHFRNMFTADMREKEEGKVKFDPLIIDPDCFKEVLNYIYTLKIDFTDENIRAIYKAADYFCFDELTTKAKEHMEGSLKIENAVLYRDISAEFDFKSFEDRCEQFIVENSNSDVIKNRLISTFSFEELQSFVEKLKRNGKFEEMFNYSVDWILHDKTTRTGRLFELLKNIPWESLSREFIKQNVSNNKLILEDKDCLAMLFNISLTISDSRKSESEVLYAIGGRDGQYLSSVSQYNNTTNEWTASTPMPSSRAFFGCAVIKQKIYVCGRNNGLSMNEFIVFDIDTRRWTQLAPMKRARHLSATAALNGQIYVAGGYCDNDTLAEVERYNVQTDHWEDAASLNTNRSGHELVALNGFLYAIGGRDDTAESLTSVERYDSKADQWIEMNNTNNKYSAFGSAVWNGNIYIAGADKCEVYSPADDKWTEMPAPTRCEFGRRLAVYNDKLYAIGGLIGEVDDWKGIKTVEVYDFQSRVWRPEPDMDVARCYHQIAVVKN